MSFEATTEVANNTENQFTEEQVRFRNFRSEIIRDVLTSGLRSSARLSSESRKYLSSHDPVVFDEETSIVIEGNVINPSKNKGIREQINDALYAFSTGSLTVVAERSDPKDFLIGPRGTYWRPITDEQKDQLTQRLESSLLVVIDPVNERGDLITPDNFYKVIIPRSIWDDFITSDRHADERFRNIVVADGHLVREVDVKPLEFVVPDYEKPIRRILREKKGPIWVHGVRLPTIYDLKQAA